MAVLALVEKSRTFEVARPYFISREADFLY